MPTLHLHYAHWLEVAPTLYPLVEGTTRRDNYDEVQLCRMLDCQLTTILFCR